jgi:hypothetical protein
MVQYNDYIGKSSLDTYVGSDLDDFARSVGVPDNYFPVAVEFYVGEGLAANIFAVRKEHPEETFTEVIERGKSQKYLKVKKFDAGVIEFNQLKRYVKLFEICLVKKSARDIDLFYED